MPSRHLLVLLLRLQLCYSLLVICLVLLVIRVSNELLVCFRYAEVWHLTCHHEQLTQCVIQSCITCDPHDDDYAALRSAGIISL